MTTLEADLEKMTRLEAVLRACPACSPRCRFGRRGLLWDLPDGQHEELHRLLEVILHGGGGFRRHAFAGGGKDHRRVRTPVGG